MVRRAEMADLSEILRVYACARRIMRENGNPSQWGDSKPAEDAVVSDITAGRSFVVEENGRVGGVFAILTGEEPTYRKIQGAWLNDLPYVTVHRVGSDGSVRGIMEKCLEMCADMAGNVRIDTHRDNKIMRHILEKNGFTYCGIIWLADGSERLAFQKVL